MADVQEVLFRKTFRRCYISNRYNIAYLIVPKCACSSIRRWFIEIEEMRDSVNKKRKELALDMVRKFPEISFDEAFNTINDDKAFMKVAPHVAANTFDNVSKLFSLNRYFRFTIVRNPYSRIFSAWINKVLQDSYSPNKEFFRYADFYYEAVLTEVQLSKNFEAFLLYLSQNRELLYRDWHWAPQFSLVRPDRVAYDCIAKLESPSSLIDALCDRLGPEVPSPLQAKVNENPISFSPAFLTPGACALIRELYAEDFSAFGYDTAPPAATNIPAKADVEAALHRIVEMRLQRLLREERALSDRVNSLQRNRLRAAYYGLRGKMERALGFELSPL